MTATARLLTLSCKKPRPSASRTYQPVALGWPSPAARGGSVPSVAARVRRRAGRRAAVADSCVAGFAGAARRRLAQPLFERAHAVLDLAPVLGVRQALAGTGETRRAPRDPCACGRRTGPRCRAARVACSADTPAGSSPTRRGYLPSSNAFLPCWNSARALRSASAGESCGLRRLVGSESWSASVARRLVARRPARAQATPRSRAPECQRCDPAQPHARVRSRTHAGTRLEFTTRRPRHGTISRARAARRASRLTRARGRGYGPLDPGRFGRPDRVDDIAVSSRSRVSRRRSRAGASRLAPLLDAGCVVLASCWLRAAAVGARATGAATRAAARAHPPTAAIEIPLAPRVALARAPRRRARPRQPARHAAACAPNALLVSEAGTGVPDDALTGRLMRLEDKQRRRRLPRRRRAARAARQAAVAEHPRHRAPRRSVRHGRHGRRRWPRAGRAGVLRRPVDAVPGRRRQRSRSGARRTRTSTTSRSIRTSKQWFAVASTSDEVVRLMPGGGAERVLKIPPLENGQDPVPAYLRYDPREPRSAGHAVLRAHQKARRAALGVELVPRAGGIIAVAPATKQFRMAGRGLTVPTDLEIARRRFDLRARVLRRVPRSGRDARSHGQGHRATAASSASRAACCASIARHREVTRDRAAAGCAHQSGAGRRRALRRRGHGHARTRDSGPERPDAARRPDRAHRSA